MLCKCQLKRMAGSFDAIPQAFLTINLPQMPRFQFMALSSRLYATAPAKNWFCRPAVSGKKMVK